MKIFTRIANSDRGASMVEYGLIVAVISMMSLSAVTLLGDNTEESFETVAEAMDAGQATDGESVSSTAQEESSDDSDQNSGDAGSAGEDSQDDAGNDDFQDDSQDEADEPSPEDEVDSDVSEDDGSSDEQSAADDDGEDSDDSANTDSDGGDDPSGEDEGNAGDDAVSEDAGEDESAAGSKGSQANPSTTASSFTWWNDNKHGGQGEWKASVTFENDWIRHQYLTLQVTTIDHQGKAKTTQVDGFYVPANGSTTFHHWGNFMKDHKGEVTGVMEVHVEVVNVKTSDEDWKPVSFPQDNGPTSMVKAPPAP